MSVDLGRHFDVRTRRQIKRNMAHAWVVVVDQLVEQSLPIPEVHGSNPVNGKIYVEHLFTCLQPAVLERRK